MSDQTNERLEREARESLVASDLSAKMKQWRNQPPEGGGGGEPRAVRWFLLLCVIGGLGWWFWPEAKNLPAAQEPVIPNEQPAVTPEAPAPMLPKKEQPEPIAQQPAAKRYIALAQSNYRSPDYSADIRGNTSVGQDALNKARQALAEHRPAAALEALQQAPTEYATDADYLRGHALFELKKYAQSAAIFKKLTGSVRYGEAAQWYGLLAVLPDYGPRNVSIMRSLKKIAADNNHTYQQQAKRLIVAMDTR